MEQQSNKLALYLLMFNMFITMGGIGIIVPVMTAYLQAFGVGGQVLGFLIAGFALAQLLLLSFTAVHKFYSAWRQKCGCYF